MTCTIDWNILSLDEWEKLYATVPRANLLQSYNYARAASSLYGLRPKWGLIKIDGTNAGLVQTFEGGIFKNALHVVTLDCGPLWLPGFGAPEHVRDFFDLLNKTFPRRFGRRRRIIPDLPDNPENRALMTACGFRRLNRPGYQTIWMDLRPEEANLMSGLESNWRNKLRKAQRAGLTTEWDSGGAHFPWLLQSYLSDRAARGYRGPSAGLLKALARAFIPAGRMMIGRTLLDGEALAGCMVLRHGTAATYQIGWSGAKGKENAAPTMLLWESALMMRAQGVYDLDLGGVNDDGAQKVKTFKEGTGGDMVALVGHYA